MDYLKFFLIPVIASLIIVGCNSPKAIQKKGDEHYKKGDYLFAERQYESLDSRFTDSTIYEPLIESYRRQGKTKELQSLLEKVVETNPSYYPTLGELYLAHQQYGKAENALNSNSEQGKILKSFAGHLAEKSDVNCITNKMANYCAQFSALSPGPVSEFEFLWSFDDGTKDNGLTVDKCFDTPGTHEAIVNVRDRVSGDTLIEANRSMVFFEPQTTFIINSKQDNPFVDEKLHIEVPSPSPNHEYVWNFGDGTFLTGTSVYHTYVNAKSLTISLYVLNKNTYKPINCVTQEISILYDFRDKKNAQ